MWQIDNRTPFAADRGWVRDRRGTEVWLVAVKCTFDVGPDGSTVVSAHQPPVLRAAEYTGAPGKSSLRFDSDLILTNKTTDVIVVGDAHAPGGRPVAELDVGLRVGPIQKILRVVGDRVWGAFGASTPEPFVRMPLLYECAFGGVDGASANPERATEWRNPVGTGFALSRDHLRGVALPNIEYRDDRGGAWKDRPRLRASVRSPRTGSRASHLPARMTRHGGTTASRCCRRTSTIGSTSARRRTSRRRPSFAAASRWCCITSRPAASCASRCRSSFWDS